MTSPQLSWCDRCDLQAPTHATVPPEALEAHLASPDVERLAGEVLDLCAPCRSADPTRVAVTPQVAASLAVVGVFGASVLDTFPGLAKP